MLFYMLISNWSFNVIRLKISITASTFIYSNIILFIDLSETYGDVGLSRSILLTTKHFFKGLKKKKLNSYF